MTVRADKVRRNVIEIYCLRDLVNIDKTNFGISGVLTDPPLKWPLAESKGRC